MALKHRTPPALNEHRYLNQFVPDTHSYLLYFFALVVPLFWVCCAQYLVLAQVAQLATITCATNFVLPASGTTSDNHLCH